MSEIVRYTAAIPPLNTISDANTRRVLEAIVSGWRTRNGELKPDSDERFITKGELSSLVGDINAGYFTTGPGRNILDRLDVKDPGGIDPLEVLRAVESSLLWKELGERIELIDLAIVAEQLARIAAVQQLADDLAAEAETRLGFDNVTGSKIAEIESVNTTQATQIRGLTTRVGNSENTIINLQQTTTTQATSLTQLTSRVTNAESGITRLDQTTAQQATSLTSLTTRVGSTESNISRLDQTSANQARSLDSLSIKLNETNAALTDEKTVRANADQAITDRVTTQVSNINGTIADIQSRQTTISNNVASLSRDVTDVQAKVGENSTLIQRETQARVDADGALYGKYSVKIDQNGYVSGFGLLSTANNATPFSDFIVRADRFAVGSPEGPGIKPAVPFTVQTTQSQLPDGTIVPPGVYVDTAYVKVLYGTYINAGLLDAAKVYTGSTLVDRESRQELLTTAVGNWSPGDVNPSQIVGYETITVYGEDGGFTTYQSPIYGYTPVTSNELRFWGPSLHGYTDKRHRVRSTSNGQPVPFLINANATVDHFLSLWYRVNGGAWRFISLLVEPQDSYGSASLSALLMLNIGVGDYIDFGVCSTNSAGSVYNGGKPYLLGLTMYATAINI